MSKNDNTIETNALLNAYLDGELTPAKKEKVEQMLKKNSEARQMLSDLKNVSTMVNSLPQASAPPELIRDVLMDLERDLLLDQSDDLAEIAGRKHLAFRRFAAAAAMIALTGAIAFIIHSTWSDANNLTPPSGAPNNQVTIANNDTDPTNKPLPKAGTTNTNTLEVADNTQLKNTKPITIPPLKVPEFQYSSLALIVKSSNGQIGRFTIEELLTEENIENPMAQSIDGQQKQYAFLCTLGQFKGLFRSVNQNSLHPIDLELIDQAGKYQVTLTQASISEAMKLASEGNQKTQLADLMQLASLNRITFTGDTSGIAQSMQTYIATADISLSDMHISGNEENTTVKPAVTDPNDTTTDTKNSIYQPSITANSDTKPDTNNPPPAPQIEPPKSNPVKKVAVLLTIEIIPTKPAPQAPQNISTPIIPTIDDPNTITPNEMPAPITTIDAWTEFINNQ